MDSEWLPYLFLESILTSSLVIFLMAMELPKSLDIFGLFWMFNEMYFSAILPQRIS